MVKRNKFGFEPLSDEDVRRAQRDAGPVSVAVRETAATLNESTAELVRKRRQNAEEAQKYRDAVSEGRVAEMIRIDKIRLDDLPRDRIDLDAVAQSETMEELKASIRSRGQKEPIEVWRAEEGTFQLKKGWRRLTALRQLFEETGDERFAEVSARVAATDGDRLGLFIDMVEENVIREDLTFAELAWVAIAASRDAGVVDLAPEQLVGRIYASLHKVKQSYIRAFVSVLMRLGEDLKFPKAVSRDLGVEVARRIKEAPESADGLREALRRCRDVAEQDGVLRGFVSRVGAGAQGTRRGGQRRDKYEFTLGGLKVTAKGRECRLLARQDFGQFDRERLEAAAQAFQNVLYGE